MTQINADSFICVICGQRTRGIVEGDGRLSEQRRSSIQVTELKFADNRLTCDRDQPTHIRLEAGGESPDSK
jgi:hypothetical protein